MVEARGPVSFLDGNGNGTDAGGITLEIHHNGLLRAVVYPDSDDRAGNRITSTDPAEKTISYAYDASGQRSRVIEADAGRFTCTHDEAGGLDRREGNCELKIEDCKLGIDN